MSIFEKLKKPRVQIEHLTEDELRWLGINTESDAAPSELTDLGLLRQDMDVKCLGGENIRAVKLYPRGKESGVFVVQTELPNRVISVASSGNELRIVREEIDVHCQRDCQGGNACLKKSS